MLNSKKNQNLYSLSFSRKMGQTLIASATGPYDVSWNKPIINESNSMAGNNRYKLMDCMNKSDARRYT